MMRCQWFDEYCLKKPGAQKDFKAEWNWIRYLAGGKMFAAAGCDEQGNVIFLTLKCEPEFGDYLRRTFSGITAGYYMNKVHWNTVWFDKEEAPDEVVREMADRSYRLVFASLSKKAQAAILGVDS